MPVNDARRISRPLTAEEIKTILAGIGSATSSAELLHGAVRDLYTALLADTGATFDDVDAEHRLRATDYAIPTAQWQAIVKAITDRAAQWGTGAQLGLNLVNLMPSSYDDPAVPAPAVPTVDRRPDVHHLQVSREATDVIAACDAHVQALGQQYGRESEIYLDAFTSWHHQLARLFSMGLGADTRITKDGPLSLFVSTGSGFVFGVLFHGAWRRCTIDGCAAVFGDDGAVYPPYSGAPVAEHDHAPSYPLDAPQPGQWSFHS